MHRAIVRQSGRLPDSLFVAFTEICRARWTRELDDDLDTGVNTEAEEHDGSDEEDEEVDDDSDVFADGGYWAL
jgi:hypothetical protein